MNDFSAHLKTTFRLSIFLLSFSIMGWALLPEYRGFAAGFVLGTVVSIVNSYYLALKIHKISEVAVRRETQKVNIGFITRASLALLAVVAAVKYEHIEFSTTLAGLFTVQIIALFVGVAAVLRQKK
jgi:ATP synthase protein I